jgi:hypothetical protein
MVLPRKMQGPVTFRIPPICSGQDKYHFETTALLL